MKIKTLLLGNMQTNGYVVSDENHHCLIIDPGANGKKVVHYLTENELVPEAVLLTHGHFDHIGAVDYLYEHYHCPIYLHQDDLENLPVFSHLLPKPGEYLSCHLLFLLFQDKQNSP